MKAVLEINSATVRVFSDGAEFGDPFDFALVIVGDEKTAIIKGLRLDADQQFTARHVSAITRCLTDAGFTRAIWHRWRRGPNGLEQRTITLDTSITSGRSRRVAVSGNAAVAGALIDSESSKGVSLATH